MDVARPASVLRNKRIKRAVYSAILLVVVSVAALGLSRMNRAAPNVDKAAVWTDTVKRGSMVREVRGLGTLVPEELRWIPALRDGLVEKINAHPGDNVKADTILLEMSNPELQQSVQDAELQVRGAEADLANTRAQLQTQVLNQQAAQVGVESAFKQAKMQAEVDEALALKGLGSDITMRKSKVAAEALQSQNEMEKRRVEMNVKSADSQIQAAEARIDQLRAALAFKRTQVDLLRVRAGAKGVLQQLPVEVGQRVTPGTILAKVAEPGRLKAELKIAETQAKDIAVGQIAAIDTRNGIIPGQVIHIDPAAVNGTVSVDVRLNGELPKGARPDLSVDGTIEIERLSDVLFVGRPAFGQEKTTVGMFKLQSNGEAIRIAVKLGRSSVNTIEVVEGLQTGDQVILSDMSEWASFDRVRLH
jgi:HlyD family secretion protein